VASEAISVGDIQIALPGVGSYVARAIQQSDLAAVGWAIGAMTIAIVLYDQLLFRPMVAWADKFRFEQTASQIVPNSLVLDLFRRSRLLRRLGEPIGMGLHRVSRARLAMPQRFHRAAHWSPPARMIDAAWYGFVATGIGYVGWELVRFARSSIL
jgi:NitT/TauT family transport system permease protein